MWHWSPCCINIQCYIADRNNKMYYIDIYYIIHTHLAYISDCRMCENMSVASDIHNIWTEKCEQMLNYISVFSRAGWAGCRPAPGLCRPAGFFLNRAEIELSENVCLISVSLLVTELWPFKVWVKNHCKNSTKILLVEKITHKAT